MTVPARWRWEAADRLVVDGVEFVADPRNRFRSTVDRFCLVKPPALAQRFVDLLEDVEPEGMVELGIWQGGSAALAALLVEPRVLLAVDNRTRPVEALEQLIDDRGLRDRVRAAYGVDQADAPALRELVDASFGATPIDLVVDDASHLVEPTRSSFNVLFPRLRPGGTYVIEDWGWAHAGFGTYKRAEVPLTVLVFELVMALGTRPDIVAEVRIERDLAVVVRGEAVVDPASFDLARHYTNRARSLVAPLADGPVDPSAGG